MLGSAIRAGIGSNGPDASDRRAVFVDLEAYEAAGGVVTRDLFAEDEGGEASPAEDEDDFLAHLPERLLLWLTAHRMLAPGDAVAKNPHVALTALLRLDTFLRGARDACLEVPARPVFFPPQAADFEESASAKSVAVRHEAGKADLPRDSAALWDGPKTAHLRGALDQAPADERAPSNDGLISDGSTPRLERSGCDQIDFRPVEITIADTLAWYRAMGRLAG